MLVCDYHLHTCFSYDADKASTPDAMCLSAINQGITDIAITDHFECNEKDDAQYPLYDADAAEIAIREAQEKYKGKLNLTYGIEIGQANQCPDKAKALLESHKYEFVISALHHPIFCPDFYFLRENTYEESEIDDFFKCYMQELSDCVDSMEQIDTVAHLTYMHRYINAGGRPFDFSKHKDIIAPFFEKIIKRDIALEVNTSVLKYNSTFKFDLYHKELLSLYRECGGKLLTVGSDSHSPQYVGNGIAHGIELMKKIGFDKVTIVRNREKTQIKI